MQTIPTIAELRDTLAQARLSGKTIGVVPTMGALHAGHISLIEAARSQNDIVVMTLFVNPTQFNDPSDFAKYPRDTERDSKIAVDAGIDIIFAPEPSEIYPEGFKTTVSVRGLSEILEGASRPGHFDGVATVVTKLLNIVHADRAYFGLKDYQQLQIVKRLNIDLNIGTQIVACPIVREADGLAMSSRNVRLTSEQRAASSVLSKALFAAKDAVTNGETRSGKIAQLIRQIIQTQPLATLDYGLVVHPETLAELDTIDPHIGAVALIAAKFGDVRLIDNILLTPSL